ncbi:MAG: 2-iminoacetate synthase ThiH [Candidatus Omnitrophica bacterium]|nr:2-iminoacetate synthase ThiH [Candidatus Omnitrophota bacterium]
MLTIKEIKNILLNSDRLLTEKLAGEAKSITEQFFGRTISLYTPIYLSNYCSSHCTYCGFNSHNKIKRIKLSLEEMRREMEKVSATGIEHILLLTGESYEATPLEYLKAAVNAAKEYFSVISLEVHPMETAEYRELFSSGVDGITIYQETYDSIRYKEVHLSGKKSDYNFRLNAPERAAAAGMRYITLGILLGLSDAAEDLLELFRHLEYMEKTYPGVEYSLSFPRLRNIKGKEFARSDIDDITLFKIICLARINFPRVGINLSTRENQNMRDNLLGIGVTRMSAGSNTSVGGYDINPANSQEPQFDIKDSRSAEAIMALLKAKGFDPILTDWRSINRQQ